KSPAPPPGCGPPAQPTTPEPTPAYSPARSAPRGYPIHPGVRTRRHPTDRSTTIAAPCRRSRLLPRLGGHSPQHPPESLNEGLDAVGVEPVGANLHLPADAGRLTGL